MFFVWLAIIGAAGCGYIGYPSPPPATALPSLPGQNTGVFSTEHASFGEAAGHFFNRRPSQVTQPFEFPHVIHIKQGINCTDYCHTGALTGPVAVIPQISTCMTCHDASATDRPRIMQLAAMRDKGQDLAWNRVFSYYPESHVRFNHAPHIRANVECTTCHGNISEQTVAQRNVNITMGTCVNCHNERKAPVDCLTCHF
jgi:hypothetical protein